MQSDLHSHFSRIVNLVQAGRLNFFLGSAVHWPTKLMAKHFYLDLAQTFECEALADQRAAVTQHIADRHGRETLDAEIDKLLERSELQPREAHELFGAWPRLRQASGEALPWPWVFTTNYDDVLEQVLRAEKVPHHVFVYHADGEWRGHFCQRTPDGCLRVIERPDNLLTLEPGLVLVKLNGGAVPGLVRGYVSTAVDYVQLAASIPAVLPAVARQRLRDCPLLFLGHGLAEPDVEALVRYAHQAHRGVRSWAVVLNKADTGYWRQCGVDILDRPVNTYVAGKIGAPHMIMIKAKARDAASFETSVGVIASPRKTSAAAGEAALVGIRPNDVRFAAKGEMGVVSTITLLEPLGDVTVVSVEAGGETLRMVLPESTAANLATGQSANIYLDPNKFHYFRAASGEAFA